MLHRFATIASFSALLATGALAQEGKAWDINQTIDQTNFIVADAGAASGKCSGTLISLKYGLVLTNEHCVLDSIEKVEKEEVDSSGEVKKVTREIFKDMELRQTAHKDFEPVGSIMLQAKIIAHVAKYDLALLKIKADRIPQKIASQVLPEGVPVKRGDHVYVVGNPYMLDANLTEGVISSTNRILHWDETNEDIPYYGVDAGVNPGNSGGALYNEAGQLIGVPAAGIRSATGLGFAIPAKLIRAFLGENCYADVWDSTAKDHAACEKDKLDEKNAARAKAGLPPLKALPGNSERIADGGSTIKPASLVLRPSLIDSIFGAIR